MCHLSNPVGISGSLTPVLPTSQEPTGGSETNRADEKASAVANSCIGAGASKTNLEKYLGYLKNGGLFNLNECSGENKGGAFCGFIIVNVNKTLENTNIDDFSKADYLRGIISRLQRSDPKTHNDLLKNGKLVESIIKGCITNDNDAHAFMDNIRILKSLIFRYCDFGDYKNILTDVRYHPSVTKIFEKHIFNNALEVSHAYFTFEAIQESLSFFKRHDIKSIIEPGCGSGYLGLLLEYLLKSLDKKQAYPFPYLGVELKQPDNGGYFKGRKMQRLIKKITDPNDFSYLSRMAESGACLFISYAPDEKAHKSLMGVNVLRNYYNFCQFYGTTPRVMVISESHTTDGPLFRDFLGKYFTQEGEKIPVQGFIQGNHPNLEFYIGNPVKIAEAAHGLFL